jgi:hypothetical protein
VWLLQRSDLFHILSLSLSLSLFEQNMKLNRRSGKAGKEDFIFIFAFFPCPMCRDRTIFFDFVICWKKKIIQLQSRGLF